MRVEAVDTAAASSVTIDVSMSWRLATPLLAPNPAPKVPRARSVATDNGRCGAVTML